MPSGGDLIKASLQLLRVIGAGQDIPGDQADDCLARLNSMIDGLAIQPLTMTKAVRTTKTLASGTASYTLGDGGDISIVRPFQIERVGLILDTSASTPQEVPRRLYADQEWAAIVQKTLQSEYIHGVWDNHSFDADERTTLYVWPIPNIGTTQLVLYTRQAVATLDDFSTDVDLTPGLQELLEYNGAIRLAPIFDAVVDDDVRMIARNALNRFKSSNVRPTKLAMPAGMPGLRRGRGDIRLG